MGKKEIENSIVSFEKLLSKLKKGEYAPFYVLMGEEPFYSDLFIKEIEERALTPEEKGFNQTIVYGSDISAAAVVEASRRYPMMATRQVVIVKEAQKLDKQEDLEHYFASPLSSTLLVLAFNGKSLDKRGKLYKQAVKNGEVFESYSLYPEMVYTWIEKYLRTKGFSIAPDAAMILSEYCGTELRKLALELDKLTVTLEAGKKTIDAGDVQQNTGISRDYNAFELTKALSFKDSAKAIKIVRHFGASPKQFPLVVILAALFSHFSRLLRYHAIMMKNPKASQSEIADAMGIRPFFIPEYNMAFRNYPLIKCMEAISLIKKYDSLGKGMGRGEAQDGELLFELVFRILH